MDPEILKCQVYLHPDEPTKVTSEDVKKYLKELGWQEGDKIPSGMPEYTSHVLKAMGKPVTVKSLADMFANETVQATLKSALNKVKLVENAGGNAQKRAEKLTGNLADFNPDTAEVIQELANKVAKDAVEKEAKEKAQEQLTEDFDGLEEVGSDEATDSSDSLVDSTISESDNELEENEKINEEDITAHKHICPRCGFNIDLEYNPFPVTDTDRVQYVYSLLGGTEFTKTYVVADGLLSITYAAPTAYVNRMIEDQLKYDARDGKTTTYDQSYINSIRYGLAASLRNVKCNYGNDVNAPIPDIDSETFSTKGETNIVKFTKYIESEVIKSGTREALFRSTYADFVRLQVQLQHEVKAENFIKAVLDKN